MKCIIRNTRRVTPRTVGTTSINRRRIYACIGIPLSTMRPHGPHGGGCRTAAVEVRGYACVCTGTNHLQTAHQEQGNAEAAAHQENTEVERNVDRKSVV